VQRLEKIANTQNVTVKKVAITASHQVKSGVLQLTQEVDLLYIPQDNLIVSAIEVVVQEAKKASLPVIANDPCLVEKGVLFAFGSDYFKSGWQLGQMIADRLEGKPQPDLIQKAKHKEFKVNKTKAQELGLSLDTLLKEET
jgi:putative ABC transport system substrate-binding protein